MPEPIEIVNHPAHYGGDTTYEAIKVIEAWKLGFCLGNTVKYIARADHKRSALEDLKKARWYLDREIARREDNRVNGCDQCGWVGRGDCPRGPGQHS
jgi:hypothetical protein